jgi:hypothetical protein
VRGSPTLHHPEYQVSVGPAADKEVSAPALIDSFRDDCKDEGRAQHEARHRYNLRKIGSFKPHVSPALRIFSRSFAG